MELSTADPRAVAIVRQVGTQMGGPITAVLCNACGAVGALGGWDASDGLFDQGADGYECPDCGSTAHETKTVAELSPDHRKLWEEEGPKIAEHHGLSVAQLVPTFCLDCGSFYLDW